MIVWIVNAQENPPLPPSEPNRKLWRSNTLAEYLANCGHNVYRIRSAFSHQSKTTFYKNTTVISTFNYHHVYLKSTPYSSHIGVKRIFNHFVLALSFLKFAHKSKLPDIVHLCNVPLELSIAVVVFCRLYSIPFVLDVRDLWPESYFHIIKKYPKIISFFATAFLKPLIYIFNYPYRHAFAITAISQPILNWAQSKSLKRSTKHDSSFPFFYKKPRIINCKQGSSFRNRYSIPDCHKIAIYSGNIGYQTNFNSLFAFASNCANASLDITFLICGTGPLLSDFKKTYAHIPNLIFTGWLDGNDLSQALSEATFGLLAFFPTLDFSLSYPNKFVEYLAYSLIPISDVTGTMSEFMQANDLGVMLNDFTSDQSLELLKDYLHNPEDIANLRLKSQIAFNKYFDIDSVLPAMASHLQSLLIS